MYISKYFKLEEFLHSDKAIENNIENLPAWEIIINLSEFCEKLLDPLREAWSKQCERKMWGSPSLIVTSGYRCSKLNKSVKGADNSNHKIGFAADIHPANGRNLEFHLFAKDFLLNSPNGFHELINEYPINGVPQWTHISYKNKNGQQLQKIFEIN